MAVAFLDVSSPGGQFQRLQRPGSELQDAGRKPIVPILAHQQDGLHVLRSHQRCHLSRKQERSDYLLPLSGGGGAAYLPSEMGGSGVNFMHESPPHSCKDLCASGLVNTYCFTSVYASQVLKTTRNVLTDAKLGRQLSGFRTGRRGKLCFH